MKTRNIILAAFAASTAFVSCNKAEVESELIPMTFYASSEGNDTKVSIADQGSNTYSITWQASDLISVLGAGKNTTFTLATGAGTPNATFSGKTVKAATYYAVYPQSNNYSLGSLYPVVVDSVQSAIAGTFCKTVPFVAKSTGNYDGTASLSFKNVCAYFKIVAGKEYDSIVIESTNESNKLSGSVDVSMDNGSISNYGESVVSSKVTLNNLEDTTYFIAVLPVTFAAGDGFTVTTTNPAESYTYTFNSGKELERGKVYTISFD